jgi:hypothetical protein
MFCRKLPDRNRNLGAKIVEELEDHEDDVFVASGSDLVSIF